MKTLILFLISFNAFAAVPFLPNSFSTDYEESFLSTTSKKEMKSSGKIDYQFPNQIKFEVIKPDASIFISNSEKSWYYTPPFLKGEEGQVVIQSSNDLVLSKLLTHLRSGLKSNSSYDVKLIKNEAHILFKQKEVKDLKVTKIILKSKTEAAKLQNFESIDGLDLLYNSGQVIHLTFKNFKNNVNFPEQYFVFKIPPKTKVMEN